MPFFGVKKRCFQPRNRADFRSGFGSMDVISRHNNNGMGEHESCGSTRKIDRKLSGKV